MNALIEKFGALRIEQVFYNHSGRPILYSCRDIFEERYIAVLLGEYQDGESEQWLYTPISEERLEKTKAGDINLREAFGSPEKGTVYHVINKFWRQNEVLEVRAIARAEIPPDFLPKADARLVKTIVPVKFVENGEMGLK